MLMSMYNVSCMLEDTSEELYSSYTRTISICIISRYNLSSTHRTGRLSIKPHQYTILTEHMLQMKTQQPYDSNLVITKAYKRDIVLEFCSLKLWGDNSPL